MKAVFFILAAVSLTMAANDSMMSYYHQSTVAYPSVIAQQGPYNYIANVDLSTTNWTAPAGVVVHMIKAAHAGSLVVKTWTDSAKIYVGANDIEWISARKIYKTGTTADSIVVYGKR